MTMVVERAAIVRSEVTTAFSSPAFPGAPFPVETAFVIVDQGEEVQDIVMAPQPNLVTAVLTRVGR